MIESNKYDLKAEKNKEKKKRMREKRVKKAYKSNNQQDN